MLYNWEVKLALKPGFFFLQKMFISSQEYDSCFTLVSLIDNMDFVIFYGLHLFEFTKEFGILWDFFYIHTFNYHDKSTLGYIAGTISGIVINIMISNFKGWSWWQSLYLLNFNWWTQTTRFCIFGVVRYNGCRPVDNNISRKSIGNFTYCCRTKGKFWFFRIFCIEWNV